MNTIKVGFSGLCLGLLILVQHASGKSYGQKVQLLRESKAFKEVQPVYKNPAASIDDRVKDLVSRMTSEEKIGQLSALLGWEMYEKKGKSVRPSEKFKTAIKDRFIGMLWATLRADPWTKKTLETGLSPYQSALATNALQKYAIENSRLGIPVFIAEECPHGHMAIGTTVFPTSIGQGSTWNPVLIEKMGAAIAKEARVQGAHIGYGPILDLAREPRWSRVEETYGEDPYLNSLMGVAIVKGFQGNSLKTGSNIISTLKHFTAYGVPEGGHNGGSVNTGIRELYQYYLPPFKAAVKAGALSIMTAYNSIDGIPCSANPVLLQDILRDQWGFKGFTVSDLGSIEGLFMSHKVAENAATAASMALNAGLDADLGGNGFNKALLESLKNGNVSQSKLDQAVSSVLRLKFEMGLFENPYVDPEKVASTVKAGEHIALARQVARESIVLLKNQNNLLPLKKDIKSISVIGPNADNIYNQLGDYTAPQARSSITTVLDGIRNKVSAQTRIEYVKGCAIRDTNNHNIKEAVRAALNSDITIVVLGGSSARDFKTKYMNTGAAKVSSGETGSIGDMESGEGYDRSELNMLGKQNELLEALIKTGKPIVLIMIQGRPLNLNWAEKNVPAILNAWYPGQEGGHAIADVLFGDYNPAGRLPISVPRSTGQLPIYYNYKSPAKHNYVEIDAKPLYSFGYGLSYSAFQYLKMDLKAIEKDSTVEVRIKLTVKNTSQRAGDEVVQLYISDVVSSVVTPEKQLKAFKRVNFEAGEEKSIEFVLKAEDFALYNSQMKYLVESGRFTIMAGKSSDNVQLTGEFELKHNHYLKP